MPHHASSFSRRRLVAFAAVAICIPAAVLAIFAGRASGRAAGIGGVEHFTCYSAAFSAFKQRSVAIKDQFWAVKIKLTLPQFLCAPTKKNKEPITNKRSHLTCYRLAVGDKFEARKVRVENQFGTQELEVVAPVSFCAPAAKSRSVPLTTPASFPPTPDHFTCYAVRQEKFDEREVLLVDQFAKAKAKVVIAATLCTPTSKNEKPIRNEKVHLVCYKISSPTKGHPVVRTRDQFGVLKKITVRARVQLCVPSTKELE